MTKHFCNLPLYLNPNHYALLSFLVYQSNYDGTITYSNSVLLQYQKAVKDALIAYNSVGGEEFNQPLFTSLPKTREYFKFLVNNSFLLHTSENRVFLINPSLAFSKLYVDAKFYNDWVKNYNSGVKINELTDSYITHTRTNYNKKKNKYL